MTRIFKNVLDAIGMALAVAFAIFLVIVLSPIIIGVLVHYGVEELLTRFWARMRNDPVCDLRIKELGDADWEDAETKEDFIGIFELVSDKIANLSEAKQGDVAYDGFSIFDDPSQIKEWTGLNMSQILHTKHAEIKLTFDFGVYYSEVQKKAFVGPENDDDQCSGGLPPITALVTKPNLRIERYFTLNTVQDIWVVISLLRGDLKFTTKTGQLWSYVSERKVWLAQYKANNSDYGLRSEFKDQTAHKYRLDS